jgi:hypothetical protein
MMELIGTRNVHVPCVPTCFFEMAENDLVLSLLPLALGR